MNTARKSLGGTGSSNTNALAYGGRPAPAETGSAVVESWNGTNWTEVNDLNQLRSSSGGAGTNTLALVFGGQDPGGSANIRANTEEWNGTNWTETTDLSTARYSLGGAGTQTNALAIGGAPIPSGGVKTEEWTGAGSGVTRTFTDS